MNSNLIKDGDYKSWLSDLKSRIRQSQIKAAVRVNTEMLELYWSIGADIVAKQAESVWGSGVIKQLSADLRDEFPDIQGFSLSNLKYMKQFYLFYTQDNVILHQVGAKLQSIENQKDIISHQVGGQISQQVVDQLENHPVFQIPWGHHIQIITKCKDIKEALFYVQKTIENGWSRAMLMNFMEVDLYQTHGKAINNFSRWLPAVQSDLAKEMLKDPYNFGFIALTENYKERELEDALTANITKFLIELGQGFAYVGKQIPIQVGQKELYIDLLFYHLELRCYVVIELKACEFDGANTGQLGVYVSAINHQMKKDTDNPTIGLLVCKTKDDVLAQYALESSSQPIGISEYQLSKLLPENFKSALPSVEEIEENLKEKI
jgi:predicted nuclease of restriction endonuclease-like (RecB) superfamily